MESRLISQQTITNQIFFKKKLVKSWTRVDDQNLILPPNYKEPFNLYKEIDNFQMGLRMSSFHTINGV